MEILTIDTSLNKTRLGFSGTFKTRESDEKNYHSAYVISEIKKILGGKTPDAIGVNIGPGSFTGIRVGLTVARVMGQHLEIPLIGVNSCEILSRVNKDSVVIMDARRGMHYFYNGEEIKLIKKEAVAEIKPQKAICDNSSFGMLKELGFDALSFEEKDENIDLPLAECLLDLTKEKLTQGKEDFHWSRLKPLYIQTPPIFGKN